MRPALILPVVAAAAFITSCSKPEAIQAKQDSGPVQIRVAPVSTREIRRVVESVGTLYPFDETVISAEIDGRVDGVKMDLGDKVKQGQVLVHISDEEQRYLLAQMEAQLRQALERLGLKDENDKVKDIRETPEPGGRRRSFRCRAALQACGELVEQGIASAADLDQAEARFKSLQAAYDSTLYQTRNLIQEVERSKAQVDCSKRNCGMRRCARRSRMR